MSMPFNPLENQTTYVINPEDATETGRLLMVDQGLTRAMGSLFPAKFAPSAGQIVLDIACGPGGWAIDVAQAYPEVDVIGVDISHKMVRYAQARAGTMGLSNASFQVMDMLKPLEFPEDSFEFVNARYISGSMSKEDWPRLMQECVRITQPGGVIRLTEPEWAFYINAKANEEIIGLLTQAMRQQGRSFTTRGDTLGITLALRTFLRDAGLTDIQREVYTLEFSYGTEEYETWHPTFMIMYQLMGPYLLKAGVTTKEEFDRLCEQAAEEMQQPNFLAQLFFLSACGKKGNSEQSLSMAVL